MASRTTNRMMMAAVAGLLTVGALAAAPAGAAEGDKVKCYGVNSCKGSGACSGAGHGCAGKNACKGQGFLQMAKDDCLKQGGKLTAPGATVK